MTLAPDIIKYRGFELRFRRSSIGSLDGDKSMYLAFLLAIVFLFLPGGSLLRTFGFRYRIPLFIIMAPAVSAAYYGVLGVLYSRIGVAASPLTMLAPAFAVLIFDVLLARKSGERILPVSRQVLGFVVLYTVVGACIGWYVFIRSLPSFDSMVEQFDVVFHTNLIRTFINTGNFSCFGIDVSVLGNGFYGSSSAGFYPAAWHEVVALVAMVRGISLTESMNAVNWAICGVVFPVGMLGLFMFIFKGDKQRIFIGSLVPTAFAVFPWRDLLWGPIFSNLAAFCCAPAVAVAFLIAFSSTKPAKDLSKLIACGILGVVGLGLLQPNSVFATGVLVASYVIHVLATSDWKLEYVGNGSVLRGVQNRGKLLALVFLLFCIFIWTLLYMSPFMHAVVNFSWPSSSTLSQAFINVITQSYMLGGLFATFPQPLLAAVLLMGMVETFFQRDARWLIVPNAFFVAAFIVDVSSDGFLKHFLTGFWYTDPNRIAAICAITAMPFAATGLSRLVKWMQLIVSKYSDFSKTASRLMPGVAVAVIFLVANFYPNYIDPANGNFVNTAFGATRANISSAYAKSVGYSQSEEDFVKKVMEIVPDDARIINYPGDGSLAAYGFDGLHVIYNQIENSASASQSQDSSESQLIRHSLNEVASNDGVRKAVNAIGAKYVILLSTDDGTGSINGVFVPDEWRGIIDINDGTPGFKVIISQDNMRLYEIEE